MKRSLYRTLLRLHPPSFRRRFAEEMLWIYDEAAPEQGAIPLFTDCLRSMIRQWLLHPGIWKFAAGATGGLLELLMVGTLIMGPPQLPDAARAAVQPESRSTLEKFSGTWKGTWDSAAASGHIELTLVKSGTVWMGEFRFRGQDGVLHAGPLQDLRVAGDFLQFHVAAGTANWTFRGKLHQGRLTGKLQPASGAGQVSRNWTPRRNAELSRALRFPTHWALEVPVARRTDLCSKFAA